MVSEDPIRTLAVRPAELSGPDVSKSCFIVAMAPLPETGRIIATGSISCGIPSNLHRGRDALHSASRAPLAENILTATISMIRVGSSPKDVFMPSRHPPRNMDTVSFFEKAIISPNNVKTMGRAKDAILPMPFCFFGGGTQSAHKCRKYYCSKGT